MKTSESNVVLFVAKILVIAGALILCINPLTIMLGSPLYLIGILILSFSKKLTKKEKLVWTLAPIAFILMSWFTLLVLNSIS